MFLLLFCILQIINMEGRKNFLSFTKLYLVWHMIRSMEQPVRIGQTNNAYFAS